MNQQQIIKKICKTWGEDEDGDWIVNKPLIRTNKQKRKILSRLREIRKLLSDPKRWTKGTFECEGPDGKMSFCLLGARDFVCNKRGDDWVIRTAVEQVTDVNSEGCTARYNDCDKMTHYKLMRFLNSRINAVEKIVNEEV